jgi:hypothetical protein
LTKSPPTSIEEISMYPEKLGRSLLTSSSNLILSAPTYIGALKRNTSDEIVGDLDGKSVESCGGKEENSAFDFWRT